MKTSGAVDSWGKYKNGSNEELTITGPNLRPIMAFLGEYSFLVVSVVLHT